MSRSAAVQPPRGNKPKDPNRKKYDETFSPFTPDEVASLVMVGTWEGKREETRIRLTKIAVEAHPSGKCTVCGRCCASFPVP